MIYCLYNLSFNADLSSNVFCFIENYEEHRAFPPFCPAPRGASFAKSLEQTMYDVTSNYWLFFQTENAHASKIMLKLFEMW